MAILQHSGRTFEKDEDGNNIRFTGFRQKYIQTSPTGRGVKERNYKMELTFKTVRNVVLGIFDVTTTECPKPFNDPSQRTLSSGKNHHSERITWKLTILKMCDCVCKYIRIYDSANGQGIQFPVPGSKSKWEE